MILTLRISPISNQLNIVMKLFNRLIAITRLIESGKQETIWTGLATIIVHICLDTAVSTSNVSPAPIVNSKNIDTNSHKSQRIDDGDGSDDDGYYSIIHCSTMCGIQLGHNGRL